MSETVDLFWSFRSSYSYLAIDRIKQIINEYDIELKLKVVIPLAIRYPDYFQSLPSNRNSYASLDSKRVAEFYNIPFARPDPDPVLFIDGKPALNQPYINRISHLGVLAESEGLGFEFATRVGKLIWSGNTEDWFNGPEMSEELKKIGLNLKEMDEEVKSSPIIYDKELEKNAIALEKFGHWGVPTLVVKEEIFFGQDRLDFFRWRLEKLGLKK